MPKKVPDTVMVGTAQYLDTAYKMQTALTNAGIQNVQVTEGRIQCRILVAAKDYERARRILEGIRGKDW